jgi:hypothetical protein
MSTDAHGETAAAAHGDETAAGRCADETDIVPTIPAAGLDELAWSRDEDDGPGVSWGATAERASIIVLAAAVVAVVVGLSVWLGFHLRDQTGPTNARGATTTPATVVPAASLPPINAAPLPTAAPPSTVTVTPAPGPPVTVQAAPPAPRPDGAAAPSGGTDVFTICPDGHEGVVGGHTSCEFAANVRQIFYASGMSTNFTAYSPVTGQGYDMTCVGRYPAYFSDGSTKVSTRCYAGDNAEVVIW